MRSTAARVLTLEVQIDLTRGGGCIEEAFLYHARDPVGGAFTLDVNHVGGLLTGAVQRSGDHGETTNSRSGEADPFVLFAVRASAEYVSDVQSREQSELGPHEFFSSYLQRGDTQSSSLHGARIRFKPSDPGVAFRFRNALFSIAQTSDLLPVFPRSWSLRGAGGAGYSCALSEKPLYLVESGHYRKRMVETRILTPRGVTLAGTFVSPVDSVDVAVLFSHSFLVDRHFAEHFDRPARQYYAIGYATPEFDYSGHGQFGDETITLDAEVEDLRAASGWLVDQGYSRQIVYAHSFGTGVALAARPKAALTYILSPPRIRPMSVDRRQIFSEDQLADLEQIDVTTIPDDSVSTRQQFTISKQTLVDLLMGDTNKLLAELDEPTLIIHNATDAESGLLEMTQEAFPLPPSGSRVEVVQDMSFEESINVKALDAPSLEWVRRRVPVVRER